MTQLSPSTGNPDDTSDSFRLHYLRKGRRCVVSHDTLEAALRGAFKRLQKDAESAPWVSDANKRVLVDTAGVRERLAQHGPCD